MESYRHYNSKYHYSHQFKYYKNVPRHRRFRFQGKNYESPRVHQQHYSRRSNNEKGKYDCPMVQSTRASSSVYLQPTQRSASPPPSPLITVPIIEKSMGSNWKLIADPVFDQVPNKIYRFNGIVPNDSLYPEVIVKDPRTFQSQHKIINLPIDLPVPIYKVST